MADGAGPGTIYRLVPFADFIERARPLIAAHYEEVVKYRDLMVLNVDVERYLVLEAKGILYCLIGERDGVMVAYSINALMRNMHYADLVFMQNDSVYVDPAERGGRMFFALRKHTRLLAKELGAKLLIWHAKPGSALDKILAHRSSGCEVLDVMHAERL